LLSDTVSASKMKNTISNLEQSSKDITTVAENLNALLSQIKDGQGTLHYLTQESTLVRDIDSTLQNIKEGTARFNENMEALKHNFLLRGYFKKIEREQRKAAKKSSRN